MRRSVALVLLLVALVFVTCTGCAGMRLAPDGSLYAFAIGDASVSFEKTPQAAMCDRGPGNFTPAGGRELIYSSAWGHNQAKTAPGYCETVGPGVTVDVQGGNLGPGWFGFLSTAVLAYFGVPGI